MKKIFNSATEIANALKDTDLIDAVVQQMAGKDKILRIRLMDVVEGHFIADARILSEERLNQFAQELYDVAYTAVEPA
jgi:hypothetical protein